MRETTTNTINFAPECGKTLSEIRRPSTPKYFLYTKKETNIFFILTKSMLIIWLNTYKGQKKNLAEKIQ